MPTQKTKKQKITKQKKEKKVIKKTTKTIKVVKKSPVKKSIKQEIWGTGKRKTAIARVKLTSIGSGQIKINHKPIEKCFPRSEEQQMIWSPLKLLKQEKFFDFLIKVQGGGVRSQAEAIRLGIARSLEKYNPDWRKELKPAKFLTRDSRIKERKKPGLKRARRAPQWTKR